MNSDRIVELDELILSKDYKKISRKSFQFDINKVVNSDFYISWILKAHLVEKNYDLESYYCEHLIRNYKESYEIYVYLITSLLKQLDLYRIKSDISKSRLLNDKVNKEIFDGDYSVFASIKECDDDSLITLIILMLVLNDLFDNYDVNNIKKDDVMISIYENIDLAYSNGIEIDKLETIKYIGDVLFQE